MRDLINQLDTLNNTLSNVNVVRDDADDAADAKPTTNVLSTPHTALVKQIALRHGWNIVEFEELFCEAKFEKVSRGTGGETLMLTSPVGLSVLVLGWQ